MRIFHSKLVCICVINITSNQECMNALVLCLQPMYTTCACIHVAHKQVCEVLEGKERREGRLREEVSALSVRVKELEGELAQSREKTSHLRSTVSRST